MGSARARGRSRISEMARVRVGGRIRQGAAEDGVAEDKSATIGT